MIDTDKYEGHTPGLWYAEEEEVEEGKAWTVRGGDHWVVMESDGCLRIDWKKEDALLAADAPLLLAEVKRLRKEINQLPIDLHESLDMILEAHHPEVRESVMSMFGDAWGNNLTGYEE